MADGANPPLFSGSVAVRSPAWLNLLRRVGPYSATHTRPSLSAEIADGWRWELPSSGSWPISRTSSPRSFSSTTC